MKTIKLILLITLLTILYSCGKGEYSKEAEQLANNLSGVTSETANIIDTVIITKTEKVYIVPDCDTLDLKLIKKIYFYTDSINYYALLYDEAINSGNKNEVKFYYNELYRLRESRLYYAKLIYNKYIVK